MPTRADRRYAAGDRSEISNGQVRVRIVAVAGVAAPISDPAFSGQDVRG